MNDADIQRMFRQLDLILNLIQETRSAINNAVMMVRMIH